MNNITKIVNSPGKSGLLIKAVGLTIKHEVKKQKGGYLSMLLGIGLLGNLLTSKLAIRTGGGTIATSKGRYTIRAGQDL